MRRFALGAAGIATGFAAALVLGALFAGTASARPSTTGPWIVKDNGNGRAVVGGYNTRGDQTLRGLIRAWGPPSRVARLGGTDRRGCLAFWSVPNARVGLANYGYLPNGASACSPRYGRVQEIRTVGVFWRTDRGLEIGDDVASILAAYPNAVDRSFDSRTQWLLRPYEVICIGECDTDTIDTSAVIAEVPGSQIVRFSIPVGGAGE